MANIAGYDYGTAQVARSPVRWRSGASWKQPPVGRPRMIRRYNLPAKYWAIRPKQWSTAGGPKSPSAHISQNRSSARRRARRGL